MTRAALAVLLALVSAAPVRADLLAPGQDWREIAFEVVDGRPLIAAQVGETAGRMMFDTGTPAPVILNRDALALGDGPVVGRGHAASGQVIEVRLHAAPEVTLAGAPIDAGPRVQSGDFGFVEAAFGADYLGFVGAPAVDGGAFVLDYGRRVLTVLRTGPEGALAAPAPADIAARVTVAMGPGLLPTAGAFIGTLPVLLDFDTGDSGTLYARPETRARLLAEGLLTEEGRLTAVTFGGATFGPLAVTVVEAGGTQDVRPWPGSDGLRLGAAFFAEHPALWNFPAGTITILHPGADFLAPR